MKNFEIEKHNHYDKSFGFRNSYLCMDVDYDDVDHDTVDAALEVVKEILNKHWDEELFKKIRLEKALQKWSENRYGLQDGYESLEEYLERYK
jgi:hypothetical protein